MKVMKKIVVKDVKLKKKQRIHNQEYKDNKYINEQENIRWRIYLRLTISYKQLLLVFSWGLE